MGGPTIAQMKRVEEQLELINLTLRNVTKQENLTALNEKLSADIQSLKMLLMKKDEKIAMLEKRIDDLEQHTRMNDLIITGLETKHRTYARVADPEAGVLDANALEIETQSLEQQVVSFLVSKDIEVQSENFSACHLLPKKRHSTILGPPAIIVRFVNHKHKVALLRQGRKLKGTKVYLNEHLTKKNADIAKDARLLRKNGKIQSTWTWNCKVWIKTNGVRPEDVKVLAIRELNQLDEYK